MSTGEEQEHLALLQGTLDLLILRRLIFPALQRLEARGWISATWGISENNRRARFYTLTKAGRRQLARESTRWRRMAAAIARVLGPDTSEA